ncbi:hypothetical protein O6H91_Y330500 [Diphasiastrum complanatum]|nr:hypothetical protein O6H91_Y330500 [Diphasiastrum complanatum]
MELLDVPLDVVLLAISCISKKSCPPCHTILSVLKERMKNEPQLGHLPTLLGPLDQALCGGIPFGVITELVGPAGIGKTQFCLMLTVLAVMPDPFGGLNGSVIYFDTEQRFTSQRMVEIAQHKFPNILFTEAMIKQLAARVFVIVPTSVTELLDSLQKIQATIIEHHVKLLVIDSVASLTLSEQSVTRQELLGRQASALKFLAESFRIPVIVTNQARAMSTALSCQGVLHSVPVSDAHEGIDLQLRAALGTKWAHAVNIRLIFEYSEGRRWIRIGKSPVSAAVAIPFFLTATGLEHDENEIPSATEKDVMTIYGFGGL